jgi:uncharacterized 2Fe-2S/4Fe-4S cluster protein (DUF4445 family)
MHTLFILPTGKTLTAEKGALLRDVLQKEGLILDYPCGGKGSCRQCRVTVEPAPASGKGGLPQGEIDRGVRLACQTAVEGDCTLTIPEERFSGKAWKQGLRARDIDVDVREGLVRRRGIVLSEPSLEDQQADWERLAAHLAPEGIAVGGFDMPAVERLSGLMRKSGFRFQAILSDSRLLWIAGEETDRFFGLAVDLGTTTVDIALVDLETGARLGRKAFLNRQVSFGADVISRAQSFHADRNPVRAAALDTIEEGAKLLLSEAGVKPEQVLKTVIVGNPIMIHILNGLDPYQLTLVPYAPVTSGSVRGKPADYGWSFQTQGTVETLPLVSAYVGADTIAMIVSLDLEREKKTTLNLDIGTNGEMVLTHGGRMVSTSTAAGPAFEGAQISCGMRAMDGAVYDVAVSADGALSCAVVGRTAAKGICGTGLVAGIARLLEQGLIDATGRLVDPQEVENPLLRARIFPQGRELAFALTEDRSVFISQQDIRKLQLAKGAVRTGLETLLEAVGVAREDLDEVRLAGNFGAGLDARAAMRIGLIPAMDAAKVKVVGNAALRGAVLALLSADCRQRAESAARTTRNLELGGKPEFQMRFADSMMFE